MIPTKVFSLEPTKIPETGQDSFQNGPNSFHNPQIGPFRVKLDIHSHSGATPPLKRFYLQNLDGRVAHGSEKEVLAATGLSRQLFYQLRTGRTEYAKHWKIVFYEEKGVKKQIQQQGSKRKYILFFRNKGPVLKGTKADFARISRLKKNEIYSNIHRGLPIKNWNYIKEENLKK